VQALSVPELSDEICTDIFTAITAEFQTAPSAGGKESKSRDAHGSCNMHDDDTDGEVFAGFQSSSRTVDECQDLQRHACNTKEAIAMTATDHTGMYKHSVLKCPERSQSVEEQQVFLDACRFAASMFECDEEFAATVGDVWIEPPGYVKAVADAAVCSNGCNKPKRRREALVTLPKPEKPPGHEVNELTGSSIEAPDSGLEVEELDCKVKVSQVVFGNMLNEMAPALAVSFGSGKCSASSQIHGDMLTEMVRAPAVSVGSGKGAASSHGFESRRRSWLHYLACTSDWICSRGQKQQP